MERTQQLFNELMASEVLTNDDIVSDNPVHVAMGFHMFTIKLANVVASEQQKHSATLGRFNDVCFTAEQEKFFAKMQIIANNYRTALGKSKIHLMHLTPRMLLPYTECDRKAPVLIDEIVSPIDGSMGSKKTKKKKKSKTSSSRTTALTQQGMSEHSVKSKDSDNRVFSSDSDIQMSSDSVKPLETSMDILQVATQSNDETPASDLIEDATKAVPAATLSVKEPVVSYRNILLTASDNAVRSSTNSPSRLSIKASVSSTMTKSSNSSSTVDDSGGSAATKSEQFKLADLLLSEPVAEPLVAVDSGKKADSSRLSKYKLNNHHNNSSGSGSTKRGAGAAAEKPHAVLPSRSSSNSGTSSSKARSKLSSYLPHVVMESTPPPSLIPEATVHKTSTVVNCLTTGDNSTFDSSNNSSSGALVFSVPRELIDQVLRHSHSNSDSGQKSDLERDVDALCAAYEQELTAVREQMDTTAQSLNLRLFIARNEIDTLREELMNYKK